MIDINIIKKILDVISFDGKERVLKIKDEFEGWLYDKDGKLLKHIKGECNSMTNGGFDWLCHRIASGGTPPTGITHAGIGYGNGASNAFAATQTLLQGAVVNIKTYSSYVHTTGTKVFYVETQWGANDPSTSEITIQEASTFNALSSGTMISRQVFTAVTKASSDIFTGRFTYTFSEV